MQYSGVKTSLQALWNSIKRTNYKIYFWTLQQNLPQVLIKEMWMFSNIHEAIWGLPDEHFVFSYTHLCLYIASVNLAHLRVYLFLCAEEHWKETDKAMQRYLADINAYNRSYYIFINWARVSVGNSLPC